jgi:hypothetical protein
MVQGFAGSLQIAHRFAVQGSPKGIGTNEGTKRQKHGLKSVSMKDIEIKVNP